MKPENNYAFIDSQNWKTLLRFGIQKEELIGGAEMVSAPIEKLSKSPKIDEILSEFV